MDAQSDLTILDTSQGFPEGFFKSRMVKQIKFVGIVQSTISMCNIRTSASGQ